MSDIEKVKRIDRTLIAKGTVVDYYHDTIELPDGRTTTWDYVDHKGAAAVVAVTEEGKILMVKQYRNPPERITLELPAGSRNFRGEDTKIAAERELREETGYTCENMELLTSIFSTIAFCGEVIDIYLCTGLSKGSQELDDDEYLNVESYSVEELKQMIFDGKIQDAKTICGLLTYIVKKGK